MFTASHFDQLRIQDVDAELFEPPFVLIDSENRAAGSVASLTDASAALADPRFASFVGQLRPGVLAVDIDPGDSGAEPESGVAVGDGVAAWCDRAGIGWIHRASGRPGHRHIVASVPPTLIGDFRELVRRLAAWNAVSASVRTSLRPLTAPHRLGLHSPLIDGNLFGTLRSSLPGESPAAEQVPSPAQARLVDAARRSRKSRSRSEGEFGDAIARVRAGWSKDDAWAALCRRGTKAAEMGECGWSRWIWSAAVTLVDAERGVSVIDAWENFKNASPEQAGHLGHSGWLELRWRPAVLEAEIERPRRRRLRTLGFTGAVASPGSPDHDIAEIAATAAGLTAAACRLASARSSLPGGIRLKSLCAALVALARPIVVRGGSVSVRAWAEIARLDPKTIRRARDAAVELGLLCQAGKFNGGKESCDAWLPTRFAQAFIRSGKSPTGRYAPYARAIGSANRRDMTGRHDRERKVWYKYLSELARFRLSGSVLNRRQDSVSRIVLSHRRWWKSLSVTEQRYRRRRRRLLIRALGPSDRAAWIAWLNDRIQLTANVVAAAAGVDGVSTVNNVPGVRQDVLAILARGLPELLRQCS